MRHGASAHCNHMTSGERACCGEAARDGLRARRAGHDPGRAVRRQGARAGHRAAHLRRAVLRLHALRLAAALLPRRARRPGRRAPRRGALGTACGRAYQPPPCAGSHGRLFSLRNHRPRESNKSNPGTAMQLSLPRAWRRGALPAVRGDAAGRARAGAVHLAGRGRGRARGLRRLPHQPAAARCAPGAAPCRAACSPLPAAASSCSARAPPCARPALTHPGVHNPASAGGCRCCTAGRRCARCHSAAGPACPTAWPLAAPQTQRLSSQGGTRSCRRNVRTQARTRRRGCWEASTPRCARPPWTASPSSRRRRPASSRPMAPAAPRRGWPPRAPARCGASRRRPRRRRAARPSARRSAPPTTSARRPRQRRQPAPLRARARRLAALRTRTASAWGWLARWHTARTLCGRPRPRAKPLPRP